VIVNGRVSLTGSGTGIQITGAVLASSPYGNSISVLEGTINLTYDSSVILKQFETLPYSRIAFKDY
jgi:hypothetical protein